MNPAPPKISSSGTRLPGLMLAGTLVGIAALVFFLNPATCNLYPVCQFHRLTGLNCPGCGMTRALYALLHGHLETAFKDNALFVLVLAAVAARGAWFGAIKVLRRPTGEFLPAKYLWPLFAVAMVFAVLRNLPAFSFLSP